MILNNPVNTAFTMQIYASNGQAAHYITQELRSIYLDGGIFIRKFDNFSNSWTKWDKIVQNRDLTPTSITEINFNSDTVNGFVSYVVKSGICYVVLRGIRITTPTNPVILKGDMPLAYDFTYAPLIDDSTSENLGLAFVDRNNRQLVLRALKTGTGYVSFSYVVNETN